MMKNAKNFPRFSIDSRDRNRILHQLKGGERAVLDRALLRRSLEEYCLVEQVTGGPGCRHPRG